MKTKLLILLPLFVTIVCQRSFGQNIRTDVPYPIVAEAESLFNQNQPEKAKKLALEKLAEAKLPPKSRAEAQYVLGRSIYNIDGPEESLNDLINSEKQARAINDDGLLVKILVTIGAAYIELEDIENAEIYLNDGLDLATKLNDDLNIIKQQTNLASLYTLNEDYLRALKYNNEAEERLKKMTGLTKERGMNAYSKANNLLDLYIEKNNKEYLDEAKTQFEEAIKYFQEIKDARLESHARNAYGGCLLYFNDTRNAKEQVNESIRLGLANNDDSALLNGYYTLDMIYEMEGDLNRGLEALKNMLAYLKKSGTEQDYAFVQNQFTNNKEKITEAIIEAQIDLRNTKIKNIDLAERQKLTYLLMAFLALIAVGGFWYFRQNQRLMQSAIDSLIKKRDIEFINAKLRGQENEMQQLAKKLQESADDLSYDELSKIAADLSNSEQPWWQSFHVLCEQYSGETGAEIYFHPYNLDERLDDKLGQDIRFVTQELLRSAVEQANASRVDVQVCLVDDEIDIIVEVDSKEFDPEKHQNELSLKTVKKRIEELGGRLSFEKPEHGSTIALVYLPLKNRDATPTSGIYASKHDN